MVIVSILAYNLLLLQEKVKSFGINAENMFTFWDVSDVCSFITRFKQAI